MCKNRFLWLGFLGLVVVVAMARIHEARCHAQVVGPKGPGAGRGPVSDRAVPDPQPLEKGKGNGVNVTVNVPNRGWESNGIRKEPEVLLDTKAEGYGATNEDAIDSAVKDACLKVEEFLRKTYGETQYTAKPEDMKRKGIVTVATAQTETSQLTDHPQRAILQVKVTGEQVEDMRKEARDVRVHERLKWGGWGLAGLVALLLVGGGYLRLEEATKGYYTALLRVGALAILTVVAFTLFRLLP